MTDFSAGTIPSLYREVFELCSSNGDIVNKEVYKLLLTLCKLDNATTNTIVEITGAKGAINRTIIYKTLALMAWCQQGKLPSDKLLVNYSGKEYPKPQLDDLTPIKNLVFQLNLKSNPTTFNFNYTEMVQLDSITIELIPEKKGLFLKHSEYVVSSRRFNCKVFRRYNDFVALYELLLARFPYRLIPRLPPKKIVSDSHFLESRRRGLQRWLTLICRHPTISHDALVSFFLTDQGSDIQYRIREVFRRAPDEFMTSDNAANAKELLPANHIEFASNREQIRTLVNIIGKIKYLTDTNVERAQQAAHDSVELHTQLKLLGAVNMVQSSENWSTMQQGFSAISSNLANLSNKTHQNANIEQITVCERLSLLMDVLIAHKDLCERLEKGLAHDHQAALTKMLSLKKRKIQGVIKGTDLENVEKLEAKMLAQENIITNIELRSDFSLYCVHIETQLVNAYLETLSSILNSLVSLRKRFHKELADIWEEVTPKLNMYFPLDSTPSNGNFKC